MRPSPAPRSLSTRPADHLEASHCASPIRKWCCYASGRGTAATRQTSHPRPARGGQTERWSNGQSAKDEVDVSWMGHGDDFHIGQRLATRGAADGHEMRGIHRNELVEVARFRERSTFHPCLRVAADGIN